ncbi:hypothetical protein [Thermoleptolyngbya sp. C42_A2020_037]|uniref:hypothetical protein n=1 Tax=Thermoleptolyngbya sp. C42_A2020_037 TaxID=2747799 RepID=UPI0019F4B901|nr:hypothetical protein [Thermoleptolyngbya sp. C42_A2020_037]MBF2084249.1 hypothetical protein [Thermoleptolyngbya sp. C42_A2020_037]
MKCIQCGTDSNYRERSGNNYRCPKCQHPFAFEPTQMGSLKFTDGFFAKAIADLAANNTLYFTPQQFSYWFDQKLKRRDIYPFTGRLFFYIVLMVTPLMWTPVLFELASLYNFSMVQGSIFLALFTIYNLLWIVGLYRYSNSPKVPTKGRRTSATMMQVIGAFLAVVAFVFAVWKNSIIVFGVLITEFGVLEFGVTALVAITALWLGFFQKRKAAKIPEVFRFSSTDLTKWLDQWTQANGPIEKMLPPPEQLLTSSQQVDVLNSQVTAYSFDRLVVCQSDAIAQMLISNNVHFENNCAILSINGYPQPIFGTVMQMLRRNPELTVFAFHDCSPKGVSLAHQLQTSPHWFQNSDITIIDIGLLPKQVLSARRDFIIRNSKEMAQAAAKLPAPIKQALSKAELAWLASGNFVELESLSPLQLIRVLNRSIAKGQLVETEGSTDLMFVGSDHDSSFYVTESFG